MILSAKPALLMATGWKFMGSASGSGVSTRRKAASYAAAMTACNIVVVRRQQTTLTRSSPGVRLINCSPLSLDPYGRTVATCSVVPPTSVNGLYARAWRWIGLNTRKADTLALRATLNEMVGESGRAVMSSHGCIAPASVRMESRPPVRMTQTPILDR